MADGFYREHTTFGSISALFGLTHHLIDKTQYTELVTAVILSAFVPTLIAQQFFRPGCRASQTFPRERRPGPASADSGNESEVEATP